MAVELKKLSVESMALGGLMEEIDKALAEAIGHCERHPSIKKARVVEVKIFIEPEIHVETDEFSLNLTHYAVPVVPKTFGKADRAKRQRDGQYVVAGSPHVHTLDAKQMSLGENVTPLKRENQG